MKSAVLRSLTLSCLLALPGLALADWPNFQGPNRDGTLAAVDFDITSWASDGPAVVWEKELNEGFGGTAIRDGEVFLVDRDLGERDHLLCLSLEDGSEQWRFTFDYPGKLSFPGSRGVPLVEEDAVYYISGFGQVFRINRETQEPDWMVSIQDEYDAPPPKWGWAQSVVVVGDIVIVPAMSEDAGLIGLDKSSGDEVWRTGGFGDSHSTPTVVTLQGVEQAVFVATKRDGDEGVGTTISVVPSTGEVLWKTDTYFNKIPIPFPTKVTEELVWLTGGYGNGSCMIRVKKGEPQWEVEKVFDFEQGTQVHPPFLIGEHLYFLANENDNHKGEARLTGGLMCMDLEGNIVWRTGNDPFMGRGNMIQVGDTLLIQDGEVGFLRAVKPSPEGYVEIAMADVFGKKAEVEEMLAKQENREVKRIPDFKYWSPMALSGDRLIMRGQDRLICLDLTP
ncbi:MAG: PQQ-binding-like beta-propeller repeat protein [Verrucomicrobiota bacterium]